MSPIRNARPRLQDAGRPAHDAQHHGAGPRPEFRHESPPMAGLRRMPLRVQFLVCTVAVLVTFAVLATALLPEKLGQPAEAALEARASALADAIAACIGPVSARCDAEAGLQALHGLESQRDLVFAQLFDSHGIQIASVGRVPADVPMTRPATASPPALRQGHGEVRASQPIVYQGAPAGSIVVALSTRQAEVTVSEYRRLTALASLLLLAMGMLAALVLGRFMSRPVEDVVGRLTKMAQGDFTGRSHATTSRETYLLSTAINTMARDVSSALAEVGRAGSDVRAAVQEIANSCGIMGDGAHAQAEASADVSASVEQMARTAQETSRRLQETLEMSRESREAASMGLEVVRNASEIMSRSADAVARMSVILIDLGSHSDRIGAVVDVIEEIADQTNLLALNAAIEAARAGDQGRGFAVVADEVRKLAERTRQATKEIGERVAAVQHGTSEVITAMESGREAAESSRHALAREACESLEDISRLSNGVEGQIETIARASQEQADTTREIASKIENIAVIAQNTAMSAGWAADASRTLGTEAASLNEKLRRFRLLEEPREAA